jgi:hypothetical protein
VLNMDEEDDVLSDAQLHENARKQAEEVAAKYDPRPAHLLIKSEHHVEARKEHEHQVTTRLLIEDARRLGKEIYQQASYNSYTQTQLKRLDDIMWRLQSHLGV